MWIIPLSSISIEVKALMTGVCRSDIDMMNGNFGPLPLEMQGHEGLGEVANDVEHRLMTVIDNL